MTLSPDRHSARMSKITNDGLTRSGTVCFMYLYGIRGPQKVNLCLGAGVLCLSVEYVNRDVGESCVHGE